MTVTSTGPAALATTATRGAHLRYKIDSTAVTFAEFRYEANPVSAAIAWFITKVLRVRLPGSTDDPNVERLAPYAVAWKDVPPNIREQFKATRWIGKNRITA